MARTATIGPAVFKRVTELTDEGKNRTEAFQIVATEWSINPGTVSANYYRTARIENGGTRTRRRKMTTHKANTATRGRTRARRSSAPSRRQADTDLSRLANQIGELVQQLVRQVEERDRRIREVLG